MSDPRVAILAISALLVFLAAAAQAALVYIDRARLRHMLEEGRPRASALMRLLDEPSSSLSTILVIHTLALCGGAATAFSIDEAIWGTSPWLAVGLGVLEVVGLLLMQFLGRILALARPELSRARAHADRVPA